MKPSLLPLLLLLAPVARAWAGEPAIRVEVDDASASRLDVAAVVGEVAEELDTQVILEGPAPARVTVRAEGPGAVAIVYERDDGTRRERVVELPDERLESTRIVVLLVSNLARDQVGSLGAGAGAEAGAGAGPAASVPAAPAEVAPTAVAPEGPRAEVEGPAPAPRTPEERRWHIGAGVIAGAATVENAAVPFYLWGVDVGWRVGDHMGVGLAHLAMGGGLNSEGGASFVANGTPYFELNGFATRRLQPYGRVGLLVQAYTGSSYRPQGWFEAAPYAGGGARFFVTRDIAIGLEVGAHVVLTDEMNLGAARLSRWSVPGTIGLSTTFNF